MHLTRVPSEGERPIVQNHVQLLVGMLQLWDMAEIKINEYAMV